MRRHLACGMLALALGLAGCDGCSAPGADPDEEVRVLPIGALDTLGGGAFGGVVSVGGVVVEEDERLLVLQDGSGLVQVRLSEKAPPLYGERLLVQGALHRSGDGLSIDADEWLYDSTRTGR